MYGGKSMPTACSPATAFTTTTAKARVARKQSIFLKKYLDIQKKKTTYITSTTEWGLLL